MAVRGKNNEDNKDGMGMNKQGVQSLWQWLQGTIFYGELVLFWLISLFFVALAFHISFDVWGMACEAIYMGGSAPLSETVPILPQKVILTICSNTVRSLGLFFVASIGWLFLCWHAKRVIRQRTFWHPLMLSTIVVGIFSWFFWKKLWMDANEDVVRNLILLAAGVVGWYFLYWRTKVARADAATAKQGLTVERLTRAIDQLASENSPVRLGGILGLEQIARIHKEERKKIARILASFIRKQAAKNSKRAEDDLRKSGFSKLEDEEEFSAYRAQRIDIEVATNTLASIISELENIRQIQEKYDGTKHQLCDLQNTDLQGLQFGKINFCNFNLTRTDFSGAYLMGANFSNAHLPYANFTEANISLPSDLTTEPVITVEKEHMAKFVKANLFGANFSNTTLLHTDFRDSNLENATFDDAYLHCATFDGCHIGGARFEFSKNLTQEQIDKAFYLRDGEPPILPGELSPPVENDE